MRLGRACAAALAIAALTSTGCSDDDSSSSATTQPAAVDESTGQNACPVEGCEIAITDVTPEGDELRITWAANFTPDFSKNHIHVYWDTFTADQVTNDAADRGQTQGEWVPTGDYPEFVTEDVVSTSARGGSTTVCVTAADRDHDVIDSSIVDCRNVSTLL